jgi:hypothetical protein
MGSTRKQLILIKKEATYGVDSTPTNALNAVVTSSVTIKPIVGSTTQRNIIKPHFGNSQNIVVEKYVTIDFEVELAGSGTAGTAPQYSALMQACGFAETVLAGTSVTYLPITLDSLTQAGTSATIYFQRDSIKHVLLGARGTFALDMTVKQLPKFKFTFTGLLGTISDNALSNLGLVYNAPAPVSVSSTNTSQISFFGYTPGVESFTLDVANDVKHHEVTNGEVIVMTDRKVKGTIKFECPPLATKNFFDLYEKSTLGSISITHGKTAGNIIKIESATNGLGIGDAPDYSDTDGVDMLSCGLTFVPTSAGNDEVKITLT